jgi:hypothetical protein
VLDQHIQDLQKFQKAAGGYPIAATLVLLDLLKRGPDSVTQRALRDAEQRPVVRASASRHEDRQGEMASASYGNCSPRFSIVVSMSLDEQPCDAATMCRRAKLLRRTSQTLSMAEDRAFFLEQAKLLDEQAAAQERSETSAGAAL